jgi:putative copper export protein
MGLRAPGRPAPPTPLKDARMHALMKFLHIAFAIAWLGGISFMLFALRPAAA